MNFRHTHNQSRKTVRTGNHALIAGSADRFLRNSPRQGSRSGRPVTP